MKRLMILTGFLVVVWLGVSSGDPAPQEEFMGVIEPNRTVDLAAAVEGLLETVAIERGEIVEKGQVLATLESSIERSTVKIAQARAEAVAVLRQRRATLALVADTHKQDEELFVQGIISEQQIRESRTQKQLAEAEVLRVQEEMRQNLLEQERAEALLALRTIHSPFSGVVMEVHLYPGELVTSTSANILRLAEIDPLSVELIVPVSWLPRIQVGMNAEVRPEFPYGAVHTARVKVVDRVADAASGTFRVRLELPNPDHKLPAGLKCTAVLIEK